MRFFSKLSTWQRLALLLLCLFTLAAGIYSGVLQQRLINPALAPLDQKAEQALQQSLLLSSASFATARLIDRGIAFVSEAEVGVGVASVKPGQLLKPLQDMAVRYSDVMVFAMSQVTIRVTKSVKSATRRMICVRLETSWSIFEPGNVMRMAPVNEPLLSIGTATYIKLSASATDSRSPLVASPLSAATISGRFV